MKSQVGFGWSVRILGFTALATLLIPIFLMKMRLKPAKARSIIDWSAFTDAPFVCLCTRFLHVAELTSNR